MNANKSINQSKVLLAFTLAEVLITLGIIGVVAAITIPALMNSISDRQFKTAYRKNFSSVNQALTIARANGASLYITDYWDSAGNQAIFDALKRQMKVIKDCSSGDNSECWASGEMFWSTAPLPTAPAFINSDGSSWALYCVVTDGNCGPYLLMDTNGLQKPNKYGKDRFPASWISASSTTSGDMVKIKAYGDYVSVNAGACPSGGCYNTTWLME